MAAGPCRSTAHTGSATVGAAALCGHGRPLCAAVGSRNYFRRTAGVYGSRGVEAGSLPRIPANGAERAAPRPGPAPVAAPRTVDRNRSCPQSPSRAAAADPWRTAASLPLSRGGGGANMHHTRREDRGCGSQQPTSRSNERFTGRTTVYAAFIAHDQSGNERGVKVAKRSALIKRGLVQGMNPIKLNAVRRG